METSLINYLLSVFLLAKPGRAEINSFLARSSQTELSYPDVRASLAGLDRSTSYSVDHNKIKIGKGEEDFERAKQAIREWKMFDFPWVDLCWRNTPIEKNRNVAVVIRHFGFYSLNAARIVYAVDESDWFGFAYGTLEEHGESGEERFSVRLDRDSGDVVYDLYAFSKPNHFLAYLGYPLTRMLQKRFARDSKHAMFRAIKTIG